MLIKIKKTAICGTDLHIYKWDPWAQKTIPLNLSYEIVPTWQDATEKLKQQLNKDSIVLVKGSHGMGLKYLIQSLV